MSWTTEQQAEHRKLWVEALRSGKYRKTVSTLRENDCFCVLGVACDVAIENGVAAYWDNDRCVDRVTLESRYGCLPECVSKFYGGVGGDIPLKSCESASRMNDGTNLSFAAMADIIERECVNVS